MKKLICLILCMIMMIPAIVSCTGSSSDKEGAKAKEQIAESIVPDDVTFVNEDFTILCREDNAYGKYLYEITADEGATDTVNQAVYQRNRDVMDTFGLATINAKAIPGDWGNGDAFINTFRNSIDAGLGDFDLVMGYQAYMAQGELAQYFYNMYDVPYVKKNITEKDYYFQDFIEQMTINGQLKYMVGDYSLTYYDHAYVMYFNKQLAEEYGIGNLYEMVNEGKWTIDKCLEMSKGKWKDNNNDEWPDVSDTFGYITDLPNTTDAWHANFDIQPTQTSADGTITFDTDVNKMTNILTKMVEFKRTNDCYTYKSSSSDLLEGSDLDMIFKEGRALFFPATLEKASTFRGMDVDFGIIPCPMWDENQGGYYTSAQDGYSVACIPVDVKDLDMSGAVFETLSLYSYKNVVPAYYDQALKYKLTRDEDSAAMLDIIRDGFKLNFGVFYSETLDKCGMQIRNLMDQENVNYASFHASHKKGYERKLNELLKYYE